MKLKRTFNRKEKFYRLLRYYKLLLFPRKLGALKVSWSIFLGVFIGILPTIGVALLLTAITCQILRLPKLPALTSSFVSNPVTILGFYPLGYKIGTTLYRPEELNEPFLDKIFHIIKNANWKVWESFADMYELAVLYKSHFWSFFVGVGILAAVVGLICALPSYFIMLKVKKNYKIKKTR